MKTEFLNFYQQLEKDQRFEVIEFRLRFQKSMNKYSISGCCSIEEDLTKMKKNYLENLKR
ncbi:hypothetical protein SAMN02927937_00299 [Paenimyroides aquimaris]|uniref:Uncharacterized protein n=1 Tax=Paenimyroides marinum TaxID=1159016 RepID=A0A1H6JEM4_9FLAO|nr:hypothetical protein [Paenimyroides aquimaris]SEH57525.1 hypothetical protein SAMN02927937_00299 [Paenimyroides aquimaris]